MNCGCDTRKRIQTGDLLAWSEAFGSKRFSFLKLIRLFTLSEYGHVSIAWRRDDGLYHVEAVRPFIRAVKIDDEASFYVFPMSGQLKHPVDMTFFDDKYGLPYSIMDALRAYFGKVTIRDNNYQCAELAYEFYQSQGIELNPVSVTPADLTRAAAHCCDLNIFYVNSCPSEITEDSNQVKE